MKHGANIVESLYQNDEVHFLNKQFALKWIWICFECKNVVLLQKKW